MMDDEVEAYKELLSDKVSELEQLREEFEAHMESCKLVEAEFEEKIKGLEQENAALTTDNSKLKEGAAELEEMQEQLEEAEELKQEFEELHTKYKELEAKEEEKTEEIEMITQEFKTLYETYTTEKLEMEGRLTAAEQTAQQTSGILAKYEDLQTRHLALEKTHQELLGQLAETEAELQTMTTDKATADAQIQIDKQQLEDLQTRHLALEETHQELLKKLNESEAAMRAKDSAQQQVVAQEFEELQSSHLALQKEHQELCARLKESEDARRAKAEEETTAEAQRIAADQELEELQATYLALETAHKDLLQRYAEAQKDAADAQSIETLEVQGRESLEAQSRASQEEAREETIKQLTASVARLEEERRSLEESLSQLRSSSLKDEVSERLSAVTEELSTLKEKEAYQFEEFQKELYTVKRAKGELESENTALTKDLNALQEALQSSAAEVTRLQLEASLKDNALEDSKELEEARAQVKELHKQLQREERAVQELQTELRREVEVHNELQTLLDSSAELVKSLKEQNKALQIASALETSPVENRAALEEALEAKDAQISELEGLCNSLMQSSDPGKLNESASVAYSEGKSASAIVEELIGLVSYNLREHRKALQLQSVS
jgi:chromosome segregation ATPase